MRLCVFCGGCAGQRVEYPRAARRLGEELARRSITLVYGGAHLGLMGELADATLAAGGEVLGVLPRQLMRYEIAHPRISHLYVVDGLPARKLQMIELSDAFLALPGGAGTLNELSEIWTLAKLGQHSKPCGLLNTAGYYDALLAFISHAVAERFISPTHRDLLTVADQPETILDLLTAQLASDTQAQAP